MKRLLYFLVSRIFLINFFGAVITVVLFIGIAYKWLDSYTNHGNTITVPDLRSMPFKRAETFLKDKSLRVKVADSSIFDISKPPGVVIEQDPAPGDKVKDNRTVYVSITRSAPPKIKFPDLEDVSYRQAEAMLNSYGLRTGKIVYKPDLCKNCVLSAGLNGRIINKGEELDKGSVIDLILGDGIGNTRIPVPDLLGLTLEEALFVLKGSGLNIGAMVFESGIKDSMNAFISRQVPEALEDSEISQGESVDVYLSKEKP